MSNVLINADDFGMSRESNEAIKEAITAGVIQSVSVMVTMPYFLDAVAFLKKHPNIKVGLHFNMTEGVGARSLLQYIYMMIFRYEEFRILVKSQLIKQYLLLYKTGLPIAHIDSHEHFHMLPPVFMMVCQFAERCSVPRVRGCAFSVHQFLSCGAHIPSFKQALLWFVYGISYSLLPAEQKKLCSRWYLLDLNWSTTFSLARVQKKLEAAPAAATEVICHLSSAITADPLSEQRYRCKNFLIREFLDLDKARV